MSDGSKLASPVDMKRLDAMLHPRTRYLLDSRLVRVEWLMGERWDPWFNLRVFRLGGLSIHLEVGRFYARWSPIPRHEWRRMKIEGTPRGAAARNAASRNARKAVE